MGKPDPVFVLLRHETLEGVHWDLMLDTGSVLTTWQLAADPCGVGWESGGISSRRLPDHRRAYLEYEGPVSRNRGWVRLADRGTYRILADESLSCTVSLIGQRLSGRFRLEAEKAGLESWRFKRLD